MTRRMTRIAALVLALVLPLSACVGSTRLPARVAGALLVAGGALVVVDSSVTGCSGDSFCTAGSNAGATSGLLLLAAGGAMLLYNEVRTLDSEVEPAPAKVDAIERTFVANAAEIREPTTTDPMLRQLTLQASVAARAGHCEVVRSVAGRVADLDPRYRRGGFVSDHAIVACIDR